MIRHVCMKVIRQEDDRQRACWGRVIVRCFCNMCMLLCVCVFSSLFVGCVCARTANAHVCSRSSHNNHQPPGTTAPPTRLPTCEFQ